MGAGSRSKAELVRLILVAQTVTVERANTWIGVRSIERGHHCRNLSFPEAVAFRRPAETSLRVVSVRGIGFRALNQCGSVRLRAHCRRDRGRAAVPKLVIDCRSGV